MAFEAFFLPVADGQRFCLVNRPALGVQEIGAVLYIHPFAEEMNKSRRMAALQSRALAAAGYIVLQIDLHGCGDSSGDFGDATWAGWLDDIEQAARWLRQQSRGDFWLWGLRVGGLLASEAAQRLDYPCKLLLWQPVISGKQFLQQFLRIKIAGDLAGGDNKGKMERLRQQLQQGEAVEVAGYMLSPELAEGLTRAELNPPPSLARVEWLDISARPDASITPVTDARIKAWQSVSHVVRATSVCGLAFWQTAEIEECPALVEASLLAMRVPPVA